MKNAGLKNESQVGKILVSGSNALKQKNEAGVRLFEQSDLTDGIISGKLVRPNYNTDELKKSLDTTIFELIPQTPTPQPDTVLRSIYNVATQSINDLTLEVQRLTSNVLDLQSKVTQLEIVSESLRVEVDNEKLKASVAETQATTANKQVASTTIDLSNAIQNSINEAVERVSLTARIQALQESFRVQKQLTIENEKQQAAQTAIEGINGFFEQTENAGWRISPNLVGNQSVLGMYIETYNDNKFNMINGPRVAFFNFSDVEQTFTIEGAPSWLTAPGPFKVPARSAGTAGVTTVEFKWNAINVGGQSDRNKIYEKNLIIKTTSGDSLTLPVKYFKEVKRKDTWGSTYTAKSIVGQDTSSSATQRRDGGK